MSVSQNPLALVQPWQGMADASPLLLGHLQPDWADMAELRRLIQTIVAGAFV